MRRLITILAIILMGMTALSASQRWENVDAPVGVFTHVPSTAGDDAVEVAVSDGYVSAARRLFRQVPTVCSSLPRGCI